MSTTSVLSNVNLGRLDAETDVNLLDYFLVTGTVARVQQEGAKLVIGRKGSGKTALFRYLSEAETSRTVALDLDEYVWEFHRGFLETGLPLSQAGFHGDFHARVSALREEVAVHAHQEISEGAC